MEMTHGHDPTFDKVHNQGIAFVFDITEKKKAEEALANLKIARKKKSIIESKTTCRLSLLSLIFKLISSIIRKLLRLSEKVRIELFLWLSSTKNYIKETLSFLSDEVWNNMSCRMIKSNS